MCLRIRLKVNWVQNNKVIDKHFFLCHLLTIFTDTIKDLFRIHVAFTLLPR